MCLVSLIYFSCTSLSKVRHLSEPYSLIRRKADLLRSVSKMPLFPLDIDPYFSCENVCVYSNWSDTYYLLVT